MTADLSKIEENIKSEIAFILNVLSETNKGFV